MGIAVTFKDVDTNEIILANCPCDWKFEKGQVFDGFWGCRSTVEKVEMDMELENRGLMVHQMVYVKRVRLF